MTLEQIEQRLSELKSEQDKLTAELERLKADKSEVKPWRAEKNVGYCYVRDIGEICSTPETGRESDCDRYKIGNYYRTRELAEQDAKELSLRGRVRQLRDALCEGYTFTPHSDNWEIYYDVIDKKYKTNECILCHSLGVIFFDTKKHAQQACDILNTEMKGDG